MRRYGRWRAGYPERRLLVQSGDSSDRTYCCVFARQDRPEYIDTELSGSWLLREIINQLVEPVSPGTLLRTCDRSLLHVDYTYNERALNVKQISKEIN